VANKPHHRTISTAAPGRRGRGAITGLNAHEVVHVSVSKHFWMDGGCGEGRATISLGSRPYRAARCEMSSEPQEIGGGKTLARSPEVHFAVVLSRVIESFERDPVQLRNAVYDLARNQLRREAWRENSPINPLEERRLTLALESAIEGVETIYSKHDELRALRSLHRLIASSEIGRSKIMIEPRQPLLMIEEPPAQTADADHRAKGTSPNVRWPLHWPGGAPLLRGAMVAIFAVGLCAVLSQYGSLGRHAPLSAPSQPESAPMNRPAIARIDGASAILRDRRFVAAGSQGDAPRYRSDYDPPTVVSDEQPVKPQQPGCSTRTYKVPSEGGGEASIKMVRC
jgi:hypothetical protein